MNENSPLPTKADETMNHGDSIPRPSGILAFCCIREICLRNEDASNLFVDMPKRDLNVQLCKDNLSESVVTQRRWVDGLGSGDMMG